MLSGPFPEIGAPCHLLHISCTADARAAHCQQVAQAVWAETFKYLADQKVMLEGILLKPSMVTPGAESSKRASPDEVADYTLKLLRRRVPPAVPGASCCALRGTYALTTPVGSVALVCSVPCVQHVLAADDAGGQSHKCATQHAGWAVASPPPSA